MSFLNSVQAVISKAWSSPNLAPSVLGAAIAFLVSTGFNVWSAVDKSRQESHDQAATFSKILTESVLTDTKPFDQNSTVFDEQKATVSLMVLDGLATTEQERRTVLYIGARLLTASSARSDSGAPGARFLDVSIGRIKSEIAAGEDKATNTRLLSLVRSNGFVDMATAGYSTQYYNDSRTMMELQPTVLGDQPITSESKLAVLVDVGPELATAWIHLASWRTSLHFSDWNSATAAAISQNYTSVTTDLYDEKRVRLQQRVASCAALKIRGLATNDS